MRNIETSRELLCENSNDVNNKIEKAAVDNPDLPLEFVANAIAALDETSGGRIGMTRYVRRTRQS